MASFQHSPLQLPALPSPPRQMWRWGVPVMLVLLSLAILTGLPWQAQRMEASDKQAQLIADTLWVEQTIRFQLDRNEETLGLIASEIVRGQVSAEQFRARTSPLVGNSREIKRLVWLDPMGNSVAASDDLKVSLSQMPPASQKIAAQTIKTHLPRYSIPEVLDDTDGELQIDYWLPMFSDGRYLGLLGMTYRIASLLDEMVPWWFAQDNEIDLLDSDEDVVAQREAGGPGRGVYTHQRVLDLPGLSLILRTNSVKAAPKLMPNLLVGAVIVLSLGLAWTLWALSRDVNRRLAMEGALREQVEFRTAMENSLVTGMRARDLEGRLTYVNPAFCSMVGLSAEQLLGKLPPMPYWVPEALGEYQKRMAEIKAGTATPQGFETTFQRSDGTRFPVLIFEAALRDEAGRHTGWMGSILDISERKQAEELSHRQREKLQSSARLASMGELASTLAHELNQPLAAISSYTTGALNLLNDATTVDSPRDALLKPALEKAAAQAQRAGQIIRSVHAFVKQREPARLPLQIQTVIDIVQPLITLQAQPSFVKVKFAIAPDLPAVLADRVLLEQVILNLTRNAIESMQQVPPARRQLRIEFAHGFTDTYQPAITTTIIDQGHGIPAEVADRLYSPFFSTKAEGMGMGLNICRTVIEFHGGTLTHSINPTGGTIFQFVLPAVDVSSSVATQVATAIATDIAINSANTSATTHIDTTT